MDDIDCYQKGVYNMCFCLTICIMFIITSFTSITMFYGTDNISQYIPKYFPHLIFGHLLALLFVKIHPGVCGRVQKKEVGHLRELSDCRGLFSSCLGGK